MSTSMAEQLVRLGVRLGGHAWRSVVRKSTAVQRVVVARRLKKPLPPFKLHPADSYVPLACLTDAMRSHFRRSTCGVHVLAAPANCGKTTAALAVGQQLYDEGMTAGHMYIDAAGAELKLRDEGNPVSIQAMLSSHTGVPVGDLVKVLPPAVEGKPVLIMIDNVDVLFANTNDSDAGFLSNVVHLATASLMTKRFNVVLMLRNPAFASKIASWNGNQKIHIMFPLDDATPTFKPTPDEMREVVEKSRVSDVLSREDLGVFTEYAIESRSVGFVAETAGLIRDDKKLPSTRALEAAVKFSRAHWDEWDAVLQSTVCE